MNIRNKWFLVLAGLATASLVFAAACGGDDDDDSGDGGETPAATSTPAAATAIRPRPISRTS